MVELFEEDGVRGARRYLDHLKMEYAFWMDGAESLILIGPIAMLCGCRTARCSTVTGTIATRRVTNRLEDVETAKHSGRPPTTRCTAIYVRGGLRLGLLFPLAA